MGTPEVIVLYSSDSDEEEHRIPKEDTKLLLRKRPRPKDDTSSPRRKKLHLSSSNHDNQISEHQQQQHQQVLLYLNDKNECVVTEGLMEFLRKIPFVRCCAFYKKDSSQQQNKSCSLFHIQQKDKWSCGFRNMQMILTSILPFLEAEHLFWEFSATETRAFASASLEIPSVLELQRHMEAAWKEGFDLEGAQHYGNAIVGKTVWIGAVEVAHLFSYMGIDATVVQFIRCPESRKQLVPFCISYFERNHCTTGCSSSSSLNQQRCSSLELVQTILQSTKCWDSTNLLKKGTCTCHVHPLYLQWKGHSVCVVGYEVDGTNHNNVHLLAFDPMKSGSVLKKALQNNQVKPLRLDQTKLERQDCQIVVCSSLSLPKVVRERECLQTATAAERAVLQAMNK